MQRRNLVAGVLVLVGGATLIYAASQANEPSVMTAILGVILAVAMGIALAVALLADPKHFRGAPRQSWFVVMFVVLLGAAAFSFANGTVAIAVAALLAVATATVLFARTRHESNGERPPAAS